MRKKFLLHIIFLVIAFVVVWIIIVNQKIEVFNKDDLRVLSCGWPLKFIVNDQSRIDPPFPWKISCLGSPLDDPFKFYWPQLIIDVLIFYAFIIFLWSAYVALNNKLQ